MRSAAGPQRTFAQAPADMAEVLRERLAVRGGKAIGVSNRCAHASAASDLGFSLTQ